MVNKRIFLLSVLLMFCVSAMAQDYSIRTIKQTETSKEKASTVIAEAEVERDTYEGARTAALVQAMGKYFFGSEADEVEHSIKDEDFQLIMSMNLRVSVEVRKTSKGTFEATCRIAGDGKESFSYYPKR